MNWSSKKFVSGGEVIITSSNDIVWTVLGSCVTVIIYSKKRKIGAVCHAQLPEKHNQDKCSDGCSNPCFTNVNNTNEFKYVTCSIRYMIKKLKEFNIKKSEVVVYLYGGASMFGFNSSKKPVGTLNVEMAEKMIKKYKLNINKKEVLGNRSRKIIFYNETGEVIYNKQNK